MTKQRWAISSFTLSSFKHVIRQQKSEIIDGIVRWFVGKANTTHSLFQFKWPHRGTYSGQYDIESISKSMKMSQGCTIYCQIYINATLRDAAVVSQNHGGLPSDNNLQICFQTQS